jgi:hypothetical protein
MRAFLIVSGLVLPAGITTPADAAGFDCGPRDMLTTKFQADFSELPSGVGVTSTATLIRTLESQRWRDLDGNFVTATRQQLYRWFGQRLNTNQAQRCVIRRSSPKRNAAKNVYRDI